ncbi:MAG: hypothetical protein WD096_09400 [Actinomycetota bacterium]
MTNLDDRLRGIDRLTPPDLLTKARGRAQRAPSRPFSGGGPRRIATIVVALTVGLSGVAAAFFAFDRDARDVRSFVAVPERIVFSSLQFPDEPGRIYSMDPDGENRVLMIRGGPEEDYSSASLSSDGARLAFVHFDRTEEPDTSGVPQRIYVADADGSNATEIFRSTERPLSITALRWSPDGASLAFILRSIPPGGASEADWTHRLWVMGADGSNAHPVSDEQITSFSWAPDGERLAVTRESLDGNRFVDDIFVIGLDGSTIAQLTAQGESRAPVWSPDGLRIMFAEGSVPDGPRVMVMQADGSDPRPIAIDHDGYTEPLTWAPDSEQALVGAGSLKSNECSLLVVSPSGETSVLLQGSTFPPSSLETTQSPRDDPCVQSASWVGTPAIQSVSSTSAPPSSQPGHLEPLMLTASLDVAPAVWAEVARVPMGDEEQELGVQPCYHCGEQLVPSALAVDADGGLWIADAWKARIAHFAPDGSFVEAFPVQIGSAIPGSSGSADLAFVGDRLYVLEEEGGSTIIPLGADGPEQPIVVNDGGRALEVQAVIPGQDEILVMISGAERLLGSYWAFASVDPMTGQVTPSPGVRSGDGRLAEIVPTGSGDWEVRWSESNDGLSAIQELETELIQAGERSRATVGDTYVRTATERGIATVWSVGDARGTYLGAWYLELTADGADPVFERLPGDAFIGDARRHLTLGPDGHVYWMRVAQDGLHVYRR